MIIILTIIGIINIISIPLSLWIKAKIEGRLYISDLLFAWAFGVFYLIVTISDWNLIVWKRKD